VQIANLESDLRKSSDRPLNETKLSQIQDEANQIIQKIQHSQQQNPQ